MLAGDRDPEKLVNGNNESGNQLTKDMISAVFGAIVDEISDEDGWASLSQAGNILTKRFPSFDVRSFGFMKLTPFIKSLGGFEVYSEKSKRGNVRVVYVRHRQ